MRTKMHYMLFLVLLLLWAVQPASAGVLPQDDGEGGECESPLPTQLAQGMKGQVVLQNKALNVRSEPEGLLLGQIRWGNTFQVVGGPKGVIDPEDDCLRWWLIRVDGSGLLGWVVEGWEVYWIAPWAGSAGVVDRTGTTTGGVPQLSGVLMRTEIEENLTEWGLFQAGTGYITLGWSWLEPLGGTGCAIPKSNPAITLAEMCALARSY